ncbi:MAG: hypothetical protein HYT38_00175 [Candidatus Sungbacteria bacterium]|uniref:Uncharacterized protein n=1 Tax=Candidatus Sungiibacteriota bacterium TaxID=2750080 RepID=A0A931YD97_9BACT|nr:hypothetical protein [Candidatus Sungbacteria bacterium]MBI2465727.1 hypothetical protein [Candidatus Sungbacteria bacterium]
MKKYLYIFACLTVVLALAAAYKVNAQKVSFPVAELGNCANEAECKTFCDDPANISQCVDFAEKNNLMSPQEVSRAKKFIKAGAKGPGGCRGEAECSNYCEDIGHIDECLSFAERTGLIDEVEVAEARKVSKILKEGGSLPGGCKNKAQCETYCNDFDHAEECFDFASKSGFIPEEELGEARKAVDAIKKGNRPPGGCKNKAECESFCSDPNNIEECFTFAEKAGFIPPEEIEQARKVIPLMKAGKMPGGCKNKNECEAYCEDEANMEVCANFAIEAGFMAPEEAEMFRKTGGKGPGGCRGRQCEDFCNDSANQEQCFNFASEHGLIPPEELEQMKEGFQQFREGIESAPEEVVDCLRSSLGSEKFDKLQSGQTMPGPQMGEAMRNCFEDFGRSQFEGGEGEGFGPPEGFEGGFNEGGFGPPPGVSPEDFEKFKQEGGFPGGEGGGFPSKEEMERFQSEGFEQFRGGEGEGFGPEGFNPQDFENGRPSPDQIQGIIQQRTKEIIQQRTQEQMQKFGAPSGAGDFGPSGTGGGFNQDQPSKFQGQFPLGGFEQFNPQSGSGDGGGQFSPPPPPSDSGQLPPPTSSAWQVVLFPLLNLLEK